MTKSTLITNVAAKSGLTKAAAEKAVDAVLGVISDTLIEGGKIQLIGFGSFEVRERKAKDTRNPRTQEVHHTPAKNVPVFKPSKILKDKVNNAG